MVKRAPSRRRPRKAKPGTRGLIPAECRLNQAPAAAAEAVEAIEKAGGCLVGSYIEPLGGHPVLLSILPIAGVEPTPFQRDLSDAHHKRLADVINKTGRFLDPIIAIVAPKGGFWTPNGRHRLEAMRRLGAKSISTLVVADREVAWQILALNTADPSRLKQVVVNLLDNAIKYTPEGGKVSISVTRRDHRAILEVADTGLGISANDLPHIFDRFYRADKARSRQTGGTGLGLSIVRSICQAHGGQVTVNSAEGRGSRFRVELPLSTSIRSQSGDS
jgi:anti-sigma regulatory factor (Ser/Thr protein kinase)